MRLLSARALHLDEAAALYRAPAPALGGAVERLTELLAGAGQVWLPSAIGGHSDHAFARDAGLRAADAARHDEVMLYADFPYVIAYGWPSWVSGGRAPAYLDASFLLADQVIFRGLHAESLTPGVSRRHPPQRAMKTPGLAPLPSQGGVPA